MQHLHCLKTCQVLVDLFRSPVQPPDGFLVLFLSEGDASGLAVKRRLAGRQGRSTKCGTALKRGTDTQQASGFGARSF